MSIKKLYIDQQIAEYPEVTSITRRLGLPAEIVANSQEVYDRISGAPDPIQKGKTVLFEVCLPGSLVESWCVLPTYLGEYTQWLERTIAIAF